MIEVDSEPSCFQKRFEPHSEQKPRLACGDAANQVRRSAPSHSERCVGDSGSGKEMAGLLAALHTVAEKDAAQLSRCLERNRAAEAGTGMNFSHEGPLIAALP